MELQPVLKGDLLKIRPLLVTDFNALFEIASDPLIWIQHPSSDRYKLEVFREFFQGALESCGAFVIFDTSTNQIIGSSRYYNFDADFRHVFIGYTFLARNYWGGRYNLELKLLMLNHAFKEVEAVFFDVGVNNIRSQKALGKINAQLASGNEAKLRYVIKREDFLKYENNN
ncbi:GNAT family N-acetyltransferase [Peredibacter starrii]|uniref:GNAT family N-acetyltransferase n=1 Tax=Peredibacter starrii TaxID=28202 RepID=A0AAX4HMT2_9BACT|nr:GNAT family N-acetyltransferase [Peredibacter starrii]WPU64536.1 GNAT family N-acetyltransferase [Peredibacter starrii]